MIRKFSALLAALVLALATLAPTAADARDRRGHGGYYDRGHHGGYGHHRRYRGHDDDGDAIAAGAVGLILGLALGSMASQPREPRYSCSDDYRRCAPPPRCSDPCGYRDSYYRGGPRYSDERYYDDRGGSAYAREYGYEGSYDPYLDDRGSQQCTRRERQWDRYANRYVTVDVPC